MRNRKPLSRNKAVTAMSTTLLSPSSAASCSDDDQSPSVTHGAHVVSDHSFLVPATVDQLPSVGMLVPGLSCVVDRPSAGVNQLESAVPTLSCRAPAGPSVLPSCTLPAPIFSQPKSTCDQPAYDTHNEVRTARGDSFTPARHTSHDTQPHVAGTGLSLTDGGHTAKVIHTPVAAIGYVSDPNTAHLVDMARGMHRRHEDIEREEKSLTLRMRAVCRRLCGGSKAEADVLYDAFMERDGKHAEIMSAAPHLVLFDELRGPLRKAAAAAKREMKKLAHRLPAWPWVEALRGFGEVGFARIVAEAGDLGSYSGPAKLWKRMGLAVIGGQRQQKMTNKDAAAAHGYCPRRHSIMWNIGESLIKAKNPYRDLYLARKVHEVATFAAQGIRVVKSKDIPKDKGEAVHYRSEKHVHNRARRYVEKRLLRDLWRAWRGQSADVVPAWSAP